MKLATAAVTAALIGGLVAGCGGGSGTDAYCDELKSAQKDLGALNGSTDDVNLDDVFSRIHELAGEAPDAVADDWKTLDGAIDTIQQGFKDAGISAKELQELQKDPTKMPEGVDATKLTELGTKMQSLSDEKFTKASQAISKHAKDECDIDMGSSS